MKTPEDPQCGGWVLGDNRGNVRCTEARKHKGVCKRPPACRLPDKGEGTCYLDIGHDGECSLEFGGRCKQLLVRDDLLIRCRMGIHHRGDCETKRSPREAATRALLARLGGETWLKIPADLDEEDRYAFEQAFHVDGVRLAVTGDVISLTLEKAPASREFKKP